MTNPSRQPPESPMDRAMERVTDNAPVEVLRPPTSRRIVRGKPVPFDEATTAIEGGTP